MSLFEEQHTFYHDDVPAQFNRMLARQRELALSDASEKKLLEEMQVVRTGIRVEVESDTELFVHRLEIERGEMTPVGRTDRPPFCILRHRLDDFSNMRRECGASILGFLGAMAGLGDAMLLTSQRVRSLRALAGSLLFEVKGPRGFSLVASFGVEKQEPKPRAAIRLEPALFEALRSGRIDAQEAFFAERIEVEGDLEMAIGLALAALSPD